jgi:hypothetical protein
MLLAAGRRLVVLVCVTTGITVVVSLVVGALAGSGVSRSVSLGFYLVGSFLTVMGFFIGNRGPVRLKGSGGAPLFGTRFVRWATPSEREETINDSAIFVFLGLLLIILGIVVDSRITLL